MTIPSEADARERLLREIHAGWQPDRDLSGVDLSGANLTWAELRGANLDGACLREVNLTGADLREASLVGADLQGADLGGADFSGADLRRADLRGAQLRLGQRRPPAWTRDLAGRLAAYDTPAEKMRAYKEKIEPAIRAVALIDFSCADLTDANLAGTTGGVVRLTGANLTRANLKDAEIGESWWREAATLADAILPDGSRASGQIGERRMDYVLTLHRTYYRRGFFNVPVDYDDYVRADEGSIEIDLGDRVIQGHANRSANTNGTARIMGRVALRDWFQEHFDERDEVVVAFVSKGRIKMNRS